MSGPLSPEEEMAASTSIPAADLFAALDDVLAAADEYEAYETDIRVAGGLRVADVVASELRGAVEAIRARLAMPPSEVSAAQS